jgi:DNA modification methylase
VARPGWRVVQGDCVEKMREMPAESVHAVVCDPPYSLGFMGKAWDKHRGPREFQEWTERWAREAWRVLKPGGHLLAFGGSRTYHRMAAGIEDAGFAIRDQIMWLHAQGFPKSRDVGKEVEGWTGWGTALKPSHEPIVLARKPLVGTVAVNVRQYGTGALNIAATRIEGPKGDGNWRGVTDLDAGGKQEPTTEAGVGRWPANLAFDEEAAAMLDEQSGERPSAGRYLDPEAGSTGGINGWEFKAGRPQSNAYAGDTGGASRFFFCAKGSMREKNAGCEGLAGTEVAAKGNGASRTCGTCGASVYGGCECPDRTFVNPVRKNHHPTVKPVALMRWLVRMVTPTKVLECPNCDVLFHDDAAQDKDNHRDMPGVRGTVREGEQKQAETAILRPDLREPTYSEEPSDHEGVDNDAEGLQDDSVSGESDGKRGRVRDGAQVEDGRQDRETAEGDRGCSPPERRQVGQPDRKSGADGKASVRTRQTGEAAAEAADDKVPEVRGGDQRDSAKPCPNCGRDLEERPGRVCDPFTGSGTTGIAAILEGAEFVGIEMDPEYRAVAEARLSWWAEQAQEGDEEKAVLKRAPSAGTAEATKPPQAQESLFAEFP